MAPVDWKNWPGIRRRSLRRVSFCCWVVCTIFVCHCRLARPHYYHCCRCKVALHVECYSPFLRSVWSVHAAFTFSRYLSSTESFNVPGIANDTASFTVICALKHDESFKQILLWAYKATLIGVGIIFVHLISSRVIVKAIVFAFKRLRQRSVAGGVSRKISSKLSNSSENNGDQMAFEMTATVFDQSSSTEYNQPTSPSKRPKAAGLADFLCVESLRYCFPHGRLVSLEPTNSLIASAAVPS